MTFEEFENYLDRFNNTDIVFTARDCAVDNHISVKRATKWIQFYLEKQRDPDAGTRHFLYRFSGRTAGAEWAVGSEANDASRIGNTLFNDILAKVKRAYAPDLLALGRINPDLRREAEQQMSMIVDNILPLFEFATKGGRNSP